MKNLLRSTLALFATTAALEAAPFVLDTAHTEIGFSVRHLMVSNAHGRFSAFQGTVNFDEQAGVLRDLQVTIQASSVDTGDPKRDGHVRSPDFLAADQYPQLVFALDQATVKVDRPVTVEGRLTIRGVTKTVPLEITYFGARTDPYKVRHAGFSATTKINRKDFGVSWNAVLDEGGVALGETVTIEISAEIIPQPAPLPVAAAAAPSLDAQLRGVTEKVREQIPADRFTAMVAATEKLKATGIAEHSLQVGQMMPEFSLPDPTGRLVSSRELLARGPLLVTFYRGNWCPYCNLALAALQTHLPEIQSLGASLVAISPQTPDNSLTMQEKHSLAFPVLSDKNLTVARRFGLVFTLPDELRPIYKDFGIDLVKQNGTDTYELPLPATYLIDRSGKVRNAFIEVDYRRRLDPVAAVEWLKKLSAGS